MLLRVLFMHPDTMLISACPIVFPLFQGKSVVTEYPPYAQAFIGLLLASSVCCIPLTALYTYWKRRNLASGKRERTVSTVSA